MKRILLFFTLILGIFLFGSCKKGDTDVTYYLGFYSSAGYVNGSQSDVIKQMVGDAVESWKKDYVFHWDADPGRSLTEQDAEAVRYMEEAHASFSAMTVKLKNRILLVNPDVVLTLEWTFEAIRDDGNAWRLSTRKVTILNGNQNY